MISSTVLEFSSFSLLSFFSSGGEGKKEERGGAEGNLSLDV